MLTQYGQKKRGRKANCKRSILKKIKKSNHLNRLVTLSPLTDMASKLYFIVIKIEYFKTSDQLFNDKI